MLVKFSESSIEDSKEAWVWPKQAYRAQLANSFMWVGGQFLSWVNFKFNAVDRIQTWGTKSDLRCLHQALNLKRHGEIIQFHETFSNYVCFYKRRVKEVIKSRDAEGNIRIIFQNCIFDFSKLKNLRHIATKMTSIFVKFIPTPWLFI